MKKTDQDIINLFRSRLENLESPVDPAIWTRIEAGLPAAGAATAAAVKGASVLLKWLAAAFITGTIVVVAIVLPDDPEQVINTEQSSETSAIPPTLPPDTTSIAPGSQETVSPISKENQVADDVQITVPVVETPSPVNDNTTSVETAEASNQDDLLPPVQQPGHDPDLRGAPEYQSADRPFDAAFVAKQVSEDELKFFFFPNYPDESSYLWEFADFETSNDLSTSFTFPQEGTYPVTLTVKNHKGVTKISTLMVEAWYPSMLVVPNIFTANNDDKNKCLDVLAMSRNITVDKVLIYDRSGNPVFESRPDNVCWDGYDKQGNALDEGIYVWQVWYHDNRGKEREQKGTLTLLRN